MKKKEFIIFLKTKLKHPITQNALSLYGVKAFNGLIPILAIPYLTRTVENEDWGRIVFFNSFALWISLFIEFGFILSGTREIAQHRDNLKKISEIIAGVNGAKFILIFFTFFFVLLLFPFIPLFKNYPIYLFWSLFWGISQGLSPLWIYQGLEKLIYPALCDIFFKIIALSGIFLTIKKPGDGWIFINLQGLASFGSLSILSIFIFKEIKFLFPSKSIIVKALRQGWSLFIYRFAVSFYTTANAFILGLLVPSTIVGYFGGAEKIAKGFLIFIGPLSQAIYPRINYLLSKNKEKAINLAKLSLAFMLITMISVSFLVYFFAPLIVKIILGPGFEPVITTLRILIWILPFMAIGNILGIQWMIPNGLEKYFNRIIMISGLLNIIMAILLCPKLGANGMAISVLCSEIFVTLGTFYLTQFAFKSKYALF
ncbi:MAG: flippase [Candidatus Helarchaeota archaeon]